MQPPVIPSPWYVISFCGSEILTVPETRDWGGINQASKDLAGVSDGYSKKKGNKKRYDSDRAIYETSCLTTDI